jgi:hypothetical protein
MTFRWNARAGMWYWGLFGSDDTAIATGRPLVAGWDLLYSTAWTEDRPPGSLIVTTPDGLAPDLIGIESATFFYSTADA